MEENVARAKQSKRPSSKATLDHVIGSTGRDGAFDFASKTEILDRMSGPMAGAGTSRKVDEFKKKAKLCGELAAGATEASIRLSYEELARSWRELADEAEKLTSKRIR